MATPQTKTCASKHCDNIIDNRKTPPRRGNMNQNAANDMNGLPPDHNGPTNGIKRYDTPKVNNEDVIYPKPKT